MLEPLHSCGSEGLRIQSDETAVNERGGVEPANEGDVREWGIFTEEARINSLSLDPTAFPFGGALRNNAQLGRLKVTNTMGDIDGDGDFDALYSFGARSFTIWSTQGELVYDSGDAIEQLIAHDPTFDPIFNAGHTNNTRDDRSDDKGREPEAVAVGEIGGRSFAFVGLERIGGVMIFDVTDPRAPSFVEYINTRDPNAAPGLGNGSDYGPEGLLFIRASDSPPRSPLLAIANEVSGTTTLYELDLRRGNHLRCDWGVSSNRDFALRILTGRDL